MTLFFLVLVVLGFFFLLVSTFPDSNPPMSVAWSKRLMALCWFVAAILWAIPGTGVR